MNVQWFSAVILGREKRRRRKSEARKEGREKDRGEGERKEEGERERVPKALYCDTFQLLCLKPVQYHGQRPTKLSYNFQILVE